MAIAFVATVIGAKALVDSGGSAAAGLQDMPGWPIVFKLPTDCRWGLVRNAGRIDARTDGDFGGAVFHGRDSRGRSVSLQIDYRKLPQAPTPDDAIQEMAGGFSGMPSKLVIGPFDSVVSVSGGDEYGTQITAAGYDGKGLGMSIVFTSESPLAATLHTFRSLCGSIEYR